MKSNQVRRRALGAAFIVALLGSSANALAQSDFPNKPVKLVVGYSPGGPTDVLGRLLGQEMGALLGQAVVVENKPGVSGNIATEFVQHAAPDGYTMIVNTIAHNVNPLLNPGRIKYDPIKDFTQVARIALLPQLIVVGGNSPYQTLTDLVKKAQSAPLAVSYGSSGVGGSAHLAGALLELRTQSQMTHVPYKGNAPALTDVMAGRVDFMFYPMIGVADHVKAGKLRVLAVATAEPHPDYPGIPTMSDMGLKGFENYAQPIGFIAPAGLPPAVTAKLEATIAAAVAKPAVSARMRSLGAVVAYQGSREYREWLTQDRTRWADLIRDAKIKVD